MVEVLLSPLLGIDNLVGLWRHLLGHDWVGESCNRANLRGKCLYICFVFWPCKFRISLLQINNSLFDLCALLGAQSLSLKLALLFCENVAVKLTLVIGCILVSLSERAE